MCQYFNVYLKYNMHYYVKNLNYERPLDEIITVYLLVEL